MNARSETANEEAHRAPDLIGHLRSLWRRWDKGKDPKARGELALLRSSALATPLAKYRMMSVAVPYLPDILNEREEATYYLVASLFALMPEEKPEVSFGKALGLLADDSGGAEARLMSILTSRHQDLTKHLRAAFSLLESKKSYLDYDILLNDLLHWDDSKRWVQNKWAYDFYRSPTNVTQDDQLKPGQELQPYDENNMEDTENE